MRGQTSARSTVVSNLRFNILLNETCKNYSFVVADKYVWDCPFRGGFAEPDAAGMGREQQFHVCIETGTDSYPWYVLRKLPMVM